MRLLVSLGIFGAVAAPLLMSSATPEPPVVHDPAQLPPTRIAAVAEEFDHAVTGKPEKPSI